MSGLVDDAIKARIVSIPKRPGPKPACTDAGPAHPGSARRSRFPGGSPPKLEPAGPERAAEGRSGSAGSAAPAPRSPTAGGYRRAAPQEPPSAAGRDAAPARAWEPGGRPRLGRCPWTRGPAHRPWAASVPAAVDERQVAHELPEGLLDTVRTRHNPQNDLCLVQGCLPGLRLRSWPIPCACSSLSNSHNAP
jgi:hypothetical protein